MGIKFNVCALMFGLAFAGAYGASSAEIVAYKSGDSMAWYHELIRDAYKPELKVQTQKLLLEAVNNPQISDEGFRLSCKILKMVGDVNCAKEIAKFSENKIRATSAFDVLISQESPQVDEILKDILKNSKNEDARVMAVYALGMRGSENSIGTLSALATAKPKRMQDAAIIALGHIDSPLSVAALKKFATAGGDSFLINNALCQLREAFILNGNFKAAKSIAIQKEFRGALLSEFLINGKDKGVAAMDKVILSDSENARNAATIANFGRTYENSAALRKAYPSLKDGAKVAAIRSFALTKDGRFLDIIRGDISGDGSAVSQEAIFACGFIGDNTVVEKLFDILFSENKNASMAATYVLSVMPIKEVDEFLKKSYEKSKKSRVLNLLLTRGNSEYKDEMLKRYFDPSDEESSRITTLVENQLGFGDMAKFWKMLPADNAKMRTKALRTFIKIASRDREADFRKFFVKENQALANFSDEELTIINSRLFPEKKKKTSDKPAKKKASTKSAASAK